jgi:hypothetical protein
MVTEVCNGALVDDPQIGIEVGCGTDRDLLVVHPALIAIVVETELAPAALLFEHFGRFAKEPLGNHFSTVVRFAADRNDGEGADDGGHVSEDQRIRRSEDQVEVGTSLSALRAFRRQVCQGCRKIHRSTHSIV